MQSKRSSKEDSKVVNFARFMKQNIEIIYKQFCANAASKRTDIYLMAFWGKALRLVNILQKQIISRSVHYHSLKR